MPPKHFSLLILTLVTVLFGCKDKGGDPIDYSEYDGIHKAAMVLQSMDSSVMAYSAQNIEAHAALMLGMQYIQQNPAVEAVRQLDSSYVFIDMKSGLQTTYFIIGLDDDGNPLTRGGGNAAQNLALTSYKRQGTSCGNKIENKKVLLYNAQFTTTQVARGILDNSAAKLGVSIKR